MLIYVHGFNSGSVSSKARELQAYFARAGKPEAVLCPDLPHRPAQAIAMLSELIAAHDTVTLVGSSLGGFYATWLAERFGIKAALVNPAVHAHLLLAGEIGEQKNYSSGEVYQFTPQHLEELAALDLAHAQHPENFLLLVETGDEVLDYRDALAYYAESRQIVVPGGNHGFLSFTQYIPAILEFQAHR
ncbi:MAG: YqiA/YcfP family alpha/beta fold hydrolase [Sulfuriferula sp.]|nr:YqiA/YcfP family alpha/beta fold hydrolase [Sulfuriferula sp.]